MIWILTYASHLWWVIMSNNKMQISWRTHRFFLFCLSTFSYRTIGVNYYYAINKVSHWGTITTVLSGSYGTNGLKGTKRQINLSTKQQKWFLLDLTTVAVGKTTQIGKPECQIYRLYKENLKTLEHIYVNMLLSVVFEVNTLVGRY